MNVFANTQGKKNVGMSTDKIVNKTNWQNVYKTNVITTHNQEMAKLSSLFWHKKNLKQHELCLIQDAPAPVPLVFPNMSPQPYQMHILKKKMCQLCQGGISIN